MTHPIEPDPVPPPPGMPELGQPARRPAPFSIADFLLVFGLGVAGSLVAGLVVAVVSGEPLPSVLASFGIILTAQAAMLLGLRWVQRRRGYPSLSQAFGLRLVPRDLLWVFLGTGLNIGLILLFLPIVDLIGAEEPAQDLVQMMAEVTNPLTITVAGVVVLVLAPLTEELTYRGLLFRLVRGRAGTTAAVAVSSVVFGLIHLLGISDFEPETLRTALLVAVPQFTIVGVVLAGLTEKYRRLGPAMATHAGYNLFSFLVLLLVPGLT